MWWFRGAGSHSHSGKEGQSNLCPKCLSLSRPPRGQPQIWKQITQKKIESQNSYPPPAPPQMSIEPTDSEKSSILPRKFLMKTHSQPPPDEPESKPSMELPPWMRNIGPQQILDQQKQHEGCLELGKISEQALDQWKSQYPKDIENDNLHYEYNFLSQTFCIKCLPLPIHDSLQIFFGNEAALSLADRFGRGQARTMVAIGSGTSMYHDKSFFEFNITNIVKHSQGLVATDMRRPKSFPIRTFS